MIRFSKKLDNGNWILLLFFLVQFPFISNAQSYGQVIYIPSGISNTVSESITDMAYWLEKGSGKHFQIIAGTATVKNGIQLLPLDKSTVSADVKKQLNKDGQSFFLNVDGANAAIIIGTGTNSYINGIYTFLQELGFRWYMPGDTWAIVPQLNKVNLKINQVYKPDFRNRSYFGTGGTTGIPGVDPQNTFQKDFDIWNRRNRINSDFQDKGHMAEGFYQAYQKELNSHPEYSCHNKVNPYGRINISNDAVVKLFIAWAIQQVNPQNRFSIIGVEPADGSGGPDDCLPSNMPGIKNWSDKYFWLANKVAQAAKEKGLDNLVELYAYSSHVAPPGFELHENVYPIIIPYAFQNLTSPEEFITLWQKKMNGRAMGIYDYWNITQWSSDLPQFNIYSISQKLRLWKQNNITTINLESTNAKGPMGHAFWLATQLMWNTDLSFESLYSQFLTQCFGPAAPDIKRMYDRWSIKYQGAMDVALSLNDLASAASKTTDTAIQKRISELKAYVHYLKLYYDYQQEGSVSKYNALINYMYGIHNLRLVQTYALKAYFIQTPTGYKSQATTENIKLIDNNEIEKNFQKDRIENPVTYTLSNFNFDLSKAHIPENKKGENQYPLYINGTNNYFFNLPVAQKVNIQAGATADTKLIIKDSKGKTWYQTVIPGTKQDYKSISVDLTKGRYTLTFGAYYRFSRIKLPDNIPFFSPDKNYDNSGYPLQYVYVPQGVTEIIYMDALRPGINGRGDWIDPGGKHIKPELVRYTTYRVPVPPQYRGKLWVLNIGHSSYKLLNIPDWYSLNPFEYKE